jgi:hypothetical protein
MLDSIVMLVPSSGWRVVLALAGLMLLVLGFGLWAVLSERRRQRSPTLRPPTLRVEPAASERLALPALDEPTQALQQSLANLQHFDRLQSDLRQRLAQAGQALAAERDQLGTAVQLMKRSAIEMRLPETVYEVYESLRLMPRKPAEAQRADRDWHGLARVESGRVLVLDERSRQTVVDLVVAGRAFRISGRSFTLSRASFDELTLFDGLDAAVMTVQVKLQADRLRVLESTVTSYRPGPWLMALVELRALMDERRERVLMQARYRDVDRMREHFGMGAAAPDWSSGS